MTVEQLQAKLDKLITYTQRLAEDHNALEERVAALEEDRRRRISIRQHTGQTANR